MNGRIIHNLHIISREAKDAPQRRYIAKPFAPNGTTKKWGVWDQRAGRYLTNAETEALSEREVREGL